MKKNAFILLFLIATTSHALPKGFVYLSDVAPDIIQDMRYITANNFIGNPIPGYKKSTCILTEEAAMQLQKAQEQVKAKGYSLKVYDCYRPQRAVNYFYQWSQNPRDEREKAYFYPRESKKELFARKYIAHSSGHTRGSTIDLTLVKLNSPSQQAMTPITRCYDKSSAYLNDDSIDMGTRFDCMDVSAHINYTNLSPKQQQNRLLLRHLMTHHGFKPYFYEWWHFTLNNEPYPDTYFNFPVS